MVISFSGHRRLSNLIYVRQEIDKLLIELRPDKVLCGMALGSDQIAAEASIALNIPLIAAMPFVGQEAYWTADDREQYLTLLGQAEKIEVINRGGFASWKYQIRNQWLVDNSGLLIAIFSGRPSGTKNCVDYATKVGKRIIIINPELKI